MSESVGFGDAPSRREPDPGPTDPTAPRVSVRFTVRAADDDAADRDEPADVPRPALPIRRTRTRTVLTWFLLGAGAALSGVVAVVMLSAWSEVLVVRAMANQSFSSLVTLGGGHGLFLLTAAFLVLVASMAKIWTLGTFFGGHREAASLLVATLALDLAVMAVSALGGDVALAGCVAVIVLDVGVIGVLGLPSPRRRRSSRSPS